MGTSKMSGSILLALGILCAVCAVGLAASDWEWWLLLLVLSSMAFVVGLLLFLARKVLRAGGRQ